MQEHARPRIVISRCLELDPCRWNGQRIASNVVRTLLPHLDYLPICPEVELGLGVPREPIHLVWREGAIRLVQPATGRDLTEAMRAHVAERLGGLPPVDGFLLKSHSPSCGHKNVRLHVESPGAPPGKVQGLFAAAVQTRYPDTPLEDEGRLTNAILREHWLTRLYTLASFRTMRDGGAMGALVTWHAQAKLLLMAHSEAALRRMGPLVANHGRRPTSEVLAEYERQLRQALLRPPRVGPTVNVLQHAFGYFGRGLSPAEAALFLDYVDQYRRNRVPLSVPVALLRGWIARLGQPYLAEQRFFAPYPQELVQRSDSGKGREV